MNYFELFELPVKIIFDKGSLSKKYFDLQKKYHPDYHTQASEEDQADMLEKSSQLNKALKVLQDKDQTIQYILQQKGMIADDEKYNLPADFLMEMMELNENLSAGTTDAIHTLESEIYQPVQSIIETYDDAIITESNLLKLKEYYFKKKYLQRILDRMNG